jgi:hypothetical protein
MMTPSSRPVGGGNGALHPQRQYGALPVLIAESELDPKRDEERHKMLLTLLAEEITKGKKLAALAEELLQRNDQLRKFE